MITTLGTIVLLAQSTLDGGGHHAPKAATCDACGAETAVILAQIEALQTSPKWRRRNDAAHALRKFDWHCHPEVAAALATALLTDCEEEVREEAAQSLAKLAPRLPEAHAALAQAARNDPDHSTRRWARKALKRLAKPCEGECDLCGTSPVLVGPPVPVGKPIPVPGPIPVPSDMDDLPPARIVVPPNLDPLPDPLSPDSSPRSVPPRAGHSPPEAPPAEAPPALEPPLEGSQADAATPQASS